MAASGINEPLPPIPAKRYFTIGEVSELCGVKPHVLRYWEQEFTQLRPVKRRGNRRYYQHHEVLLVRRIRELLYQEGFTISGARSRLEEDNSKPLREEHHKHHHGHHEHYEIPLDIPNLALSPLSLRAELISIVESLHL